MPSIYETRENPAKRRQINVRIQLWKMNAKTGGADLDFIELRGRGLFQSLRIAWQETDIEIGTEPNHDPTCFPVVVSGYGNGD